MLRRRHEIVLRLPEDIVFASGDDSVKEGAVRTLRALAATLRVRQLNVRVEGHTDNRPIHTTRFRSNWDLSTARATTVLDHLITIGGMSPLRLSAAGYGEYHPVARNDIDTNRQLNRRVDLVVTVAAEESDGGDSGNSINAALEGLPYVGDSTTADAATADAATADAGTPLVPNTDAASPVAPTPTSLTEADAAQTPEPPAPAHHSSAH